MKKKIILMLSMCALLMCLFVISASASIAFCSPDGISNDFKGLNAGVYIFDTENDFAVQEISIYDGENYNFCYLISNPLSFKNYLNRFSDFETFRSAHENYDSSQSLNYIMYYFQEYAFNYFYNYTESSGGASDEELQVKYQQGFIDGKQSGYTDGYSEGMQDFAEEEKDLIEQYYSQGGEFTANGLNEYISSNSSETFRDIYNSVGTGSNYMLLEDNFSSSSSSSSHGGSSITVTEQGENYGKSHEGDISSDCCYNPGYVDGVADGGTIYKGSDSYQADITNEINSYMRSEEYQTLMNAYSAQVVEQYIESTEYRTAIDSSFVAGKEVGEADAWEKAKDEVLAQGIREGYLNYKGSQEYRDAIDSSKTAGYIDGVEDGKNSVVDPSGVLILFAIVIFLGIIIFAIYKKSHSKKRR